MDKEFIERGFSAQPLDSTQIAQLDQQGFTVLENIIAPDWIEPLRQAFETIYAAEGTEAGKEVAQMEGVRRLADLVNKGEVFDQVYLQPTLLTAVYHIIQRSFKLHSLNGHDPLHGHGMQTLHADSGEPCTPGGPYHVVNSMWMLDDFTTDNGGTRLVPGSHLRPGRIGDYVEDRNADHPEQIQLTGKAGCVAVFNGNVWHSSFINRNGAARRTLHCAFIAREYQQQTNQRQHLRPETAGRLSPLARYILEVD